MIILHSYTISEYGRRIDYQYTASGRAKQFINRKENFFVRYNEDITKCPPGILVIPFISNFIPIAWFGGIILRVNEADEIFASSIEEMRVGFQRIYPQHRLTGELVVSNKTEHPWSGGKSLMLFSGGIDAFTTLILHRHEQLELVTILGADIDLNDTLQWNRCLNSIASESLSANFPRTTITSNFRTFYSHNVESDLVYGWWGRVQHGLALMGALAPISFLHQATKIYIASSYGIGGWGSTKLIDEKLKWGPVSCTHDGYGLTRKAKVEIIVNFARERGRPIPLRVCYSEVARDGNCGRCEKCYRSLLNIILSNADPRDYGFPMTDKTYPHILELMTSLRSSAGLRIFWGEIAQDAKKAQADGKFFVFNNRELEQVFLQRIADGEVDRALQRNHRPWLDQLARWKFIIRTGYPRSYNFGRGIIRFLRRLK